MKTIKHKDIETFPYELIEAKGDVWIKLTDALKMGLKTCKCYCHTFNHKHSIFESCCKCPDFKEEMATTGIAHVQEEAYA